MAMPAMVARINAPRVHSASDSSREDMAALRSSGGRTSGGSLFSPEPPEAPGPVKALMSRPLQVCGGRLPFSEVGDMATSGYRCLGGSPNHPGAAGHPVPARYGCGPANPPGRLAQLV